MEYLPGILLKATIVFAFVWIATRLRNWIATKQSSTRNDEPRAHATIAVEDEHSEDSTVAIAVPAARAKERSDVYPAAYHVRPAPPTPRRHHRKSLLHSSHFERESFKWLLMVIISLVMLGAGVLIVLDQHYDEGQKHWAYATLGTIVGFWLR